MVNDEIRENFRDGKVKFFISLPDIQEAQLDALVQHYTAAGWSCCHAFVDKGKDPMDSYIRFMG